MVSKVSFVPVAISIVLTMGWIMPTSAATSASLSHPRMSQSTLGRGGTLVAGRLRFTVGGIRPSRARVAGASRSGGSLCSADGMPTSLVALSPKNALEVVERERIEVESTVAARPTFFVYVPPSVARFAEFTLFDENQRPLYQSIFFLPGETGVVGVRVPEDVPSLEVGSQYRWVVSLICDPLDRSGDLVTEGWVQRLELDSTLATQLERADLRDRPALYARAGIWQDTLTSLAELRLDNPNDEDLTEDWISLLGSVDLNIVAQEPLLSIEDQPASPLEDDESTSLLEDGEDGNEAATALPCHRQTQ